MNILVTGGAGYIGSHTVVELTQAGHKVIVADNFSNSSPLVLQRLEKIINQQVGFERVNLCNINELSTLFKKYKFDGVIHFAGLKAVGESVSIPLEYYKNNLLSTLNLCELMNRHKVSKLVFSSSATVYGLPEEVPVTESAPVSATNPYGRTKVMIEQILKDWADSDKAVQVTCLRYFNPIGAHPSGLIGENPHGIPNNLLPYVSQVAVGKLSHLKVFGCDYPTPDGTGIRDYIHVVDLAKAHVAAINKSDLSENWQAYNLGTGKGTSVIEVIKTFEKISNRTVSYKIVNRRPGDVAICYADPRKAQSELGWKSTLSFQDACIDAWNWQSRNPNGYTS